MDMMKNPLLVFGGVPISYRPFGLHDVPDAVKIKCNYCNEYFWMGPLKKKMLTAARAQHANIWVGCTPCAFNEGIIHPKDTPDFINLQDTKQ